MMNDRIETIEIDPERSRPTRIMNHETDINGAILVCAAMLVWVIKEWRYCRMARERFRVSEYRLAEAHAEFIAAAETGNAIALQPLAQLEK